MKLNMKLIRLIKIKTVSYEEENWLKRRSKRHFGR